MTIVSHAFKQVRLVDGHCGSDAIAFLPHARIRFVGINPPNLPAEFGGVAPADDKKSAMQGAHDVLDHWAVDPHGVGALLAGKRRGRNPWAASQRLFAHEEERQRSGLQTRLVGDGMEALTEDSPRPWNRGGGLLLNSD